MSERDETPMSEADLKLSFLARSLPAESFAGAEPVVGFDSLY